MQWYYYIGTLIIYYIIQKFIFRKYLKSKVTNLTHLFLLSLFNACVYLFCAYGILHNILFFKVLLDGFLANTAILIAVVGFSLQGFVKHIVAGFVVSNSGAFKIGDRITLRARDLTGHIEEITLRHTIVRAYTNERVIIPNTILNEEVIINNNLKERSASYPVTFQLPIEVDLDKVKYIIEDVISKNKDLINHEVEVLCSDVTIHGVIFKTYIWTEKIEDNFRVASEIRIEVLKRLKEEGISPSFLSALTK